MTDDERALWERLLAEQPIPDVKALPLGLAAWLRHHPGESCRLVVARTAGRPVAIAPLAATRMPWSRLLARQVGGVGDLHWRCGYAITGRDVPGGIDALLDAVIASRGWDVLGFGPMLVDNPVVGALVEIGERRGMSPLVATAGRAPRVVIGGSWDAYYATLSGNLRSMVARGERRLRQHGPLALDEIRAASPGALAAFYAVEASGWKGREGSAIASDPALRALYDDLAREAAARGRFRLYLLRAGDSVVAGDFCIEHDGGVFMLKTGYAEAFAKASPGQVLRKHVLARVWGQATSYDFMPGGGEHADYKQRWANDVRPFAAVRMFHPRSVRGRALARLVQLRRALTDSRAPDRGT